MQAIERVTHQGCPCWVVTLYRDNGARGRRLHMTFPDVTFGGEARALAVAHAWRDAALAVVPPLVCSNELIAARDAKSAPGVYFKKASNTRKAYWVARFVPPGAENEAICSFSVADLGEETARALAEAECRRMEEALEPDAAWAALPLPLPPQDMARPSEGATQRGVFHDEAFYGIHRDVSPQGGRWMVIIGRTRRCIRINLSDVTFGGEAQALFVARAVRDAAARVVPPLTRVEWRQLPRRRRTPGITGVHYREGKDGRAGIWTACIQVDGSGGPRLVTRLFSEATHGGKAKALAEAERRRMLDALADGQDPFLRGPALTLAGGADDPP